MILTALLLLGAFQGLILLFPLLRYRHNRGPNRVLALLIILLVADLLLVCLNNSGFVRHYPHLYNLNSSLPFLFTPLIYFYIMAITGKIKRFRPVFLLHALPFLAHLTYMAIAFYSLPADTKLHIIDATLAKGIMIDRRMIAHTTVVEYASCFGAIGVAAIAYYIAMLKRIIWYRRDLANYYSDLKNKIYGMLALVVVISLLIWMMVALVHALPLRNWIWPMLLYAVGMYAATYKLVIMPELFSTNCDMDQSLASAGDSQQLKWESLLQAFSNEVQTSRAYLDPEITIGTICAKLGLPVHQVSKALNQCLKKNFYQFINDFRVNEAKRMFMDANLSDQSVLTIAMAAGFNSKSTFNEVFKKSTGKTPSEFRGAI